MSYKAKDIETLSFKDAIRSRIAMYMGSADNQGVLQCIREIITNSIDEATMGFGKKIEVSISPSTNLVEVVDYGRGVPFGKRDDGTEAMIAIYTTAHTGGKFNDKVYQNVAGMNGIGSKGTALSAAEFTAVSCRDGRFARLELKDGEVIKYYEKDSNITRTGTAIRFIPSQEVFNLEPIHINFEEVKKMCRDWSYLMKGITFNVTNLDTGENFTYCAPHGLIDMMKDNCNKTLNKTPLHIEVEEDRIKAEIVMSWTDSVREEAHVFTNGLENSEGGTSLTGIKTSLTNYFKKKVKDTGGNPDILRKGLYYAVSCQVPNPSFANQTKTKVNNPELRGLCQRATTQMLEDFERRHADEFGKIIEVLNKEMKAELAAERARKQVLEARKEIEKNQKKKVFSSDKLKNAEFLGENSILLLVEGDSAAGSMAKARDIKKYGILGLRGKPINAFTNDDEKLLHNEEVKLLLSAMNFSPGAYDAKSLRYGKIAICSDADADGYSIGLLIMCLIYKYAPQFIEEGRLYWLRSPLYIVKKGKEEHYFFTDEEFAQCKIKGEVIRAKGLGALSPEQARRSMFNPEFQRMEQLIPDEWSYAILSELMGKDSEPKKKFVFNNIDFSQIKE